MKPSPDSPLGGLLARQIRDRAEVEAIRSESENLSLSFRRLDERIQQWAALLGGAGLGPEEAAALSTGNVAAFPELFFALRSLGTPVLSLDTGLRPEGAREVCRRMGARRILHRDSGLGGDPIEGAPDPSVRLLDLGHVEPPPAGTALVKLTSGSTVDPRGACFTEEALVQGIENIREGMDIGPSDRVLVAIPLSHSYGFDNGVLSLAAAGTALILQPDILPAALLQTMRDRAVTFFPAVPTLIRALSRSAWPRNLALRRVICASAPLAPEIAGDFAQSSGRRVHQFFGATECGGISFERSPGETGAAGTVGLPLPGVRIELAGEGEVRIHSAANRFALLPRSSDLPPYVETGDRAELSPEGRLRLLGRTRPLANIAGFKIDLTTIDIFLRGLPGVDDAVALAVEDPMRGQRIVAYVETTAHTPAALLELCRSRLSAREVPGEIRVSDRLPRNPRGKLDRAALLEAAR